MISEYAKKLIRKKQKEQKKAAVFMRVQRANELYFKEQEEVSSALNKQKKERKEKLKEEQEKFVKEQNSVKPVGVKREIIGGKQVDNYTPEYYKTEDWISRSKALIKKAGGKCCKCGYQGKGLTMHHLTYAYKPHTEPEKILQCLCKNCHHLKHEINRILKGSPSKNMDRWNFNWKCPHKKIPEITRNIIQFAPWLLRSRKTIKGGINVSFSLLELTQNQITHRIRGFLDLDKLSSIIEDVNGYFSKKHADSLIVKSYWVSTSGDTKKHKTVLKQRFRLTWNGYKKSWHGAFVSEKDLDEFVKYCEENEIKYRTEIGD